MALIDYSVDNSWPAFSVNCQGRFDDVDNVGCVASNIQQATHPDGSISMTQSWSSSVQGLSAATLLSGYGIYGPNIIAFNCKSAITQDIQVTIRRTSGTIYYDNSSGLPSISTVSAYTGSYAQALVIPNMISTGSNLVIGAPLPCQETVIIPVQAGDKFYTRVNFAGSGNIPLYLYVMNFSLIVRFQPNPISNYVEGIK